MSARKIILTALSYCKRASVRFLQCLTGLAEKDLSSCLFRLEEAGLIAIEGRFVRLKEV